MLVAGSVIFVIIGLAIVASRGARIADFATVPAA